MDFKFFSYKGLLLSFFMIRDKILFRCENFVLICEMDFQYFDCCKDMFSAKPTFTSHGTCFTTKMSLTPRTKSPLKFVLNASKQYSQGK